MVRFEVNTTDVKGNELTLYINANDMNQIFDTIEHWVKDWSWVEIDGFEIHSMEAFKKDASKQALLWYLCDLMHYKVVDVMNVVIKN